MTKEQIFYGGVAAGAIISSLVWMAVWPHYPETPKMVAQPIAAVQPFENGSGEAIYIRGSRWVLLIGREDEMLDLMGMYGETNCSTKKVYIHGSLDLSNQRDTVIHELLHAGTCDESGHVHNKFYNSENEADHEGIYKIADYFTTLLHDNPDLGKYLYQ